MRILRSVEHDFLASAERMGGSLVISVSGELDLATAPELEEVIAGAIQPDEGHMVVDLLGVTFMDSSGIRALVQAKDSRPGTEVTLVVGGGIVHKLIDVTGLDGWFRIEDDIESALARSDGQPSSNT